MIFIENRGGYRPCSCDFTRSNCVIYIKSGNMVRKLGILLKNREKSEFSQPPLEY